MSKKMDIYAELDNFVEQNEGQVTLTDVAKHFANYGYQYAVEKACKYFMRIKECDFYEDKESQANAVDDFINRFRKAMEE